MRTTRKIYAAVLSALVVVGALVALNVTGTDAQALTAPSTRRDCTAEDIIYCGALSQQELLQDYDKNDGDVQAIFAYFGIKRTDIAGTTSEMKLGKLKLDGTIVVDGKTVATDAQSTYRIRTKPEAQTFTVNGKTYYKLPVKGVYSKEADVFVMFKNGQFFQAIQTSCGNVITATPVKPPVQPTYACVGTTATKIDRTRFRFTTTATAANGAQIGDYNYDFGDGTTVTSESNTVEHTYNKPGSYTVKVLITVIVNGQVKLTASEKCKVTVNVEPVPVKPLYACTSLTARIVKAETRTYEYSLTYTAEGGAMLKRVVYNFGDGTSRTYDAAAAAKVQHSYAKAGSYKTTATLYFEVKNGAEVTEKSISCEVTVNAPAEKCPIKGKENLPKDSKECVETPVTPPQTPPQTPPVPPQAPVGEVPAELPQTGLGGMLSGGMGLGSIAAAGYYWLNSRKNLLSALLNK